MGILCQLSVHTPFMLIPGLFGELSVLSVILLVAGISLLIIEMFVPGFGFIGITGIVLLIIDVFITANTFQEGLLLTLVLLLLVGIFAVIFFTLMSKGKLPSKLILRDSTNRSGGFSGVADLSRLNGKSGVALTELRPAGVVTIEGERVDAVTSGAFIDKGTEVSVIEISGRRVVVDTK